MAKEIRLPHEEGNYGIVAKYAYDDYPANPNGSHFSTAMICDKTGRHLVMMPHIERSTFSWNWAHYPKDRNDECRHGTRHSSTRDYGLKISNIFVWNRISDYEKLLLAALLLPIVVLAQVNPGNTTAQNHLPNR
jgi:hypothetical protein